MKIKYIATSVATAIIVIGIMGVIAFTRDHSHWLGGTDALAVRPVPAAAPAASALPADAVEQLWRARFTNIDGKPETLAAFTGRPIVINFWASWCPPCVKEMPMLAQLYRQYSSKGIEFVGIGVDSSKNVQAFLQKTPVDYPIFIAGFDGADLTRHFGDAQGGLPFTVLIDANRHVRATQLGQIRPEELKQALDALN